jgi:hypothetical protein
VASFSFHKKVGVLLPLFFAPETKTGFPEEETRRRCAKRDCLDGESCDKARVAEREAQAQRASPFGEARCFY